MYLCLTCGSEWETEWPADPRNCEKCNPYECERCPERYPSVLAAFQCCRD